jgi:molybdenum cofactor guanylyltransferase
MQAAAFNPANICAAILAGGAGSRLGGRDKGLEILSGKPLVEHVLVALKGQAASMLICANRNGERYARYAPVLPDATGDFRGPLAGISAALRACNTEWLLTVPVDSPAPPRDLAARLHSAAISGGTNVAAAHDGTRAQPLFALYSRSLADSAAAALHADNPVWRWHEAMGAARADFADQSAAFENLNTPDDFLRWERANG